MLQVWNVLSIILVSRRLWKLDLFQTKYI